MKNSYSIILGLAVAGAASASLAQSVDIPQVSNEPISEKALDNAPEPELRPGVDGSPRDYQKDVLSNPAISDVARAAAMTGGGGNTAVVVQRGSSNRSSVTQSGDNNYANQTQTGKSNDLRVEQNGNNNRSQENQTGNYNHKVKIQNGEEEDSTTTDESGESDEK